MGKLIVCHRCNGPRPAASAFCPHCGGDSAGFRRWVLRAMGAAAFGTVAACGVSPVYEVFPGADAGLSDAGSDAGPDAGVDAGQVRCFRDAGFIGADYGIVSFPDDGGCGP